MVAPDEAMSAAAKVVGVEVVRRRHTGACGLETGDRSARLQRLHYRRFSRVRAAPWERGSAGRPRVRAVSD